ncbi:hypothetical protein AWB64_03266 [Caballeronia sordidicola]|uniref:PGAP1-like protein n=1 Tax=Caballeronia sordidicola TaxID=196367 RepID=A0A158GPB3_CABSO|nr:hypothetical protein [Caballeronia sordidicola]SAL33958.1 hypothetical protein AWB64_03266 [Caballeronia sordidicola]
MPNRYPIIYIRGYAMTVSERNDTAADPFCGFNVGSTLYRATGSTDRHPAKFVFESPLVRLASEYQYQHVYQDGYDIMDPDWSPPRDDAGNTIPGIPASSIIIYRYYDDGSALLGDGKSRKVEVYAQGLNDLLLRVKELVLQHRPADGSPPMTDKDFKYYLVAHSMGGLVARAFLHSTSSGFQEMREAADKFFTFATPHNGIDVLGINVPSWLTLEQQNTFNRAEMTTYLNLQQISPQFNGRVDLIPQSAMPSDRIFCMVGTNRGDYEVLQGVVRAFVGDGSDGLVRVDNASLWGVDDNMATKQVATNYAFRSHSGYFGIVNSEEAYQNLVRFLFGDVRVDIWADIDSVTLPDALVSQASDVTALYQFEICASPKGKRWFLTRRKSVEDSPAVRSHAQLTGTNAIAKKVYLGSVFLAKKSRVDRSSSTLSYAMIFAAKVPDYEINKRFWPDGHFEGADLFQGNAIVRVTPPPAGAPAGPWTVEYGWANSTTQTTAIDFTQGTPPDITIPFASVGTPGIKGALRMVVRPWS